MNSRAAGVLGGAKKQSEMSDSEQKCDNCNCQLANVEIYVLTKGIKEQTWCSECVQTFWQDLKSEGWVADDGTWSELGFDDGEDKPAPCKDCGNEAFWIKKFDRWSVVDNLCPNCSLKEEQEEESEEEKPAPKVSVNFRNAMRLEDEYNAKEEANRKAEESE